MMLNNEKLMRFTERVLKRTPEYQENREFEIPDEENYKIAYVLFKGSKNAPEDAVAYASRYDEMLRFRPLSPKESSLCDYGVVFTLDDDLFQPLEEGSAIAGMSLEFHYNVWCEIELSHQGGIQHTCGMQKYLHYCKQHGITRNLLAEQTGYDGMDVMQLYDRHAARGLQNKKEQER